MSFNPSANQEQLSDVHFSRNAEYWRDIYRNTDLTSQIYQGRLKAVMAMIDNLRLPPSSRVLDVGCGAGVATSELAVRGYIVNAVDPVEKMLEQAKLSSQDKGLAGKICFTKGNVYDLPFPANTFNLTVALGVLPWVDNPHLAIGEMRRVTKTGGHLILTSDNYWRLQHILDPRLNPFLRKIFRPLLRSIRRLTPPPAQERTSAVNYMRANTIIRKQLFTHRLEPVTEQTVGFGPFTIFTKKIFQDATDIRLHEYLQRLAEQKVPILRSTGSHYIVLSKKCH